MKIICLGKVKVVKVVKVVSIKKRIEMKYC